MFFWQNNAKKIFRIIFWHFSARSAGFFFCIFSFFLAFLAAEGGQIFFLAKIKQNLYFLAFFEANLLFFWHFRSFFLAFFSARSADFFFGIFFKTLKKTLVQITRIFAYSLSPKSVMAPGSPHSIVRKGLTEVKNYKYIKFMHFFMMIEMGTQHCPGHLKDSLSRSLNRGIGTILLFE